MDTTSPIIPQQPIVGWTAPQQRGTPTPPAQWQQPSQWQQPPQWPQPSSSQEPSFGPNTSHILTAARTHLVGLIAALVIQAAIAAVAWLPQPPGGNDFWARFAAIELLVAVVVALAYGPGVSVGDMHPGALIVLTIAFIIVPVAALTVGTVDALREVRSAGAGSVFSTGLQIALVVTAFFGLPLIALVAPPRDAAVGSDEMVADAAA